MHNFNDCVTDCKESTIIIVESCCFVLEPIFFLSWVQEGYAQKKISEEEGEHYDHDIYHYFDSTHTSDLDIYFYRDDGID